MPPLNTRIEITPEEIEAGICPVPDGSYVVFFFGLDREGNMSAIAYEIIGPDHGTAILAALRAMPPETWPIIAQGIAGVSELTADDVIEYLKGDG